MKVLFYFFTAILLLAACNQESTVGSDLLGDETISVDFTDTVSVTALTLIDDAVITFRDASTYDDRTFMVGQLDDPVFGKSTAITYFTPALRGFFPNDTTIQSIDSVVLSLPLDLLGRYGDTLEVHTVRAHQLTDPFILDDDQDTLFSDFCSLEYDSQPMGMTTSSIRERDSIAIYDPTADSLINVSSRLRLPLESDIWDEIWMDPLNHESDSSTLSFIKGFALTSEDVTNSMFGISLDVSSPSYLEWYYVDTSGTQRLYLMDVGALRHNCYEHDFTGTEVEQAIGVPGLEKTYIKSMGGVYTEYDLTNVLNITDGLINSAFLELFVEMPDDEFYLADRVIASYVTEDGDDRVLEDIFVGSEFGGGADVFFGGGLVSEVIDGVTVMKYKLNITSHITSLINKRITNTKIDIRIFPSQERPTRSVLYSPEHPVYPSQLKLVITNP